MFAAAGISPMYFLFEGGLGEAILVVIVNDKKWVQFESRLLFHTWRGVALVI